MLQFCQVSRPWASYCCLSLAFCLFRKRFFHSDLSSKACLWHLYKATVSIQGETQWNPLLTRYFSHQQKPWKPETVSVIHLWLIASRNCLTSLRKLSYASMIKTVKWLQNASFRWLTWGVWRAAMKRRGMRVWKPLLKRPRSGVSSRCWTMGSVGNSLKRCGGSKSSCLRCHSRRRHVQGSSMTLTGGELRQPHLFISSLGQKPSMFLLQRSQRREVAMGNSVLWGTLPLASYGILWEMHLNNCSASNSLKCPKYPFNFSPSSSPTLQLVAMQGCHGEACCSNVWASNYTSWSVSRVFGLRQSGIPRELQQKHMLSPPESLSAMPFLRWDLWVDASHWQWLPHNPLSRSSWGTAADEGFQVGCCKTKSGCAYCQRWRPFPGINLSVPVGSECSVRYLFLVFKFDILN